MSELQWNRSPFFENFKLFLETFCFEIAVGSQEAVTRAGESRVAFGVTTGQGQGRRGAVVHCVCG